MLLSLSLLMAGVAEEDPCSGVFRSPPGVFLCVQRCMAGRGKTRHMCRAETNVGNACLCVPRIFCSRGQPLASG